MVEVFTVGGGDYLVNVFNAVAAWTGNGGYKGLLQVVMVMGLGFSALMLAFNQDWRAWINWFLGATLMYSCLMVPRLDVQVTDRLNPSLAPSQVANVPLGLALMASFTSQIGDYLTGSAEVVFGLPGDLNYSKNGMIYGARLYDATRSLRISDPEFAANLDEHFRQCVFYDVLLGRYSMKQLAESTDIWTTIAPGSQARAQRFLTRDTSTGEVTANIITCRDAYTSLNGQWTQLIDSMGNVFGRQLYPNQTVALAKAKLFADLPIAYQYLTGVSFNATAIFKQALTINAMSQAMHAMGSASGAGNVDVYAQTRADIQTERTYSSIASNAMKWVPLLNVVLTVLFYALFPVLFPLFLMPKTGPLALKGYVTGFFYLAAWGPLFVILHMMLMFKGAADMTAASNGGITLASFTGMADVNSDIGILAGYLIASVPFLAGGVAKGAMAISHHATSYLNPSQNAAEEAAREASTGNVSLGNTSFETSNVLTRQFAQGNVAPSFNYGAAQTRGYSESGTMTTSFAEGSYDQLPNSSYPFTPTLGQEFTSRLSTMASQSKSNSETFSNLAQQSTANAVTHFRELRNQVSKGSSFETATGQSNSDSVNTAFNEVDQASKALQRQYSLSRRASDDITTSWFLNGEGSAGLGGSLGPANLGVGVKGGRNQSWTDSDIGIASEDRSRIMGSLKQISDSRNWSSARDSFVRTVSTSTSSSISTSANGMNASLTEAQSFTQEARRSEEIANRLEQQASMFEGSSASGSLNLSQAYREWGLGEMERNRDFYGNERFDDIGFQLSAEGQALQARFIDGYADTLRDNIEDKLVLAAGKPISKPSVSSAANVKANSKVGSSSSDRPSIGKMSPDSIGAEVDRAQKSGRQRIDTIRDYLEGATRDAKGASENAADEVKKWK
ncbi:conjugal transfer protein TraG [Sphingorhabdus pulchriflava]|uniref:Conjugal transfer protein TraG n=1 Tax=Sphingorhabdus pulchriflava TaxID=2292257 RepID=A0A371BIL7_9SPHN|nr:conjugal transfer protein TraG N-terminal domain-containing protein [Sphingorhabdus pulchriflava]RDV07405.1 conjugal transfer protein TraG [Sphingorhabdus pulchriflava]